MIPISKPLLAKNAKKYLLECLKSSWISGAGPMIDRFEDDFARFVKVKYAVACTSGTTALHLALAALNIGPEDEVVLPASTMIASILPVIYTGATPVLVDVEEDTGNININLLEQKITEKTRAIMPVHLYGHCADMANLLKIADKYQVAIVEDAAEAHGAQCKLSNGHFKKVGSIGEMGCFSFYANKIVTSGEGGMVTTNNPKLATRLKSLRNLARTPRRHFFHQVIAFNYRLSSLQAALGIAQLEQVFSILKQKQHIAALYTSLLSDTHSIILPVQKDYAKHVFWQYGIIIKKDSPVTRDKLAKILEKKGIETRTFHIPLHKQPALLKLGLFKNEKYPVAEHLGKHGLNLPSGPNITDKQIAYICSQVRTLLS